jgi:hypothetical protein
MMGRQADRTGSGLYRTLGFMISYHCVGQSVPY